MSRSVWIVRRRFWNIRRADGHRVLERGVQRGELRAGWITPQSSMLYAPFYMRLLIQHASLDGAFCRTIVETVFDGIAA